MRSYLIAFVFPLIMSGQTQPNAVKLAETGRCAEALPLLKRALARTADKELKRRLGTDGVRCANAMERPEDAVDFLRGLSRDFPNDPEILYLAVHAYSDLSLRASQQLLGAFPGSPQVHELNAESLEAQGKWDEAAAEYKEVLAIDPKYPGMHYRMGRIILSKPKTETIEADARREMEQELNIDPMNAGADYVLGELDRQAEKWPKSIAHFEKAVAHDAGFADAYYGLGQAYMGAEKFAEAVGPLETLVKLQPDNPSPHYLLAVVYGRLGRKADAQKEAEARKLAAARAQKAKDAVKLGVRGQKAPPAE